MEVLEKLAKANPADIDVAEALTEAAWQNRDHDKGMTHPRTHDKREFRQ
jgi:hypothetical protein